MGNGNLLRSLSRHEEAIGAISIQLYARRDKSGKYAGIGAVWCPWHGWDAGLKHTLDASRGFCYCSAANKSGDVVAMAQAMEGISTPEAAVDSLLDRYHVALEGRGRNPLKAKMCDHLLGDEGAKTRDHLRRLYGWNPETIEALASEGSLGLLIGLHGERLSIHYAEKAVARHALDSQVAYQHLGGKDTALLWRVDKIKDEGPVFVVLGENDLIGCLDCGVDKEFSASIVSLPYGTAEPAETMPDSSPLTGRQVFILPPQRKRERNYLESVAELWSFAGVDVSVLDLWSDNQINAALSNQNSRYNIDARRLVARALAIGKCLK